MTTQEMTIPDFRVVKMKVTDYYLDDQLVKDCGGEIYDVYIFNRNQHYHLCEFTPSYEIHYIESIGEKWMEDSVQERLIEANIRTERIDYTHVASIPESEPLLVNAEEFWQVCLNDSHGDEDEAYQLAIDQVIEEYSANPIF